MNFPLSIKEESFLTLPHYNNHSIRNFFYFIIVLKELLHHDYSVKKFESFNVRFQSTKNAV